MAEDGSTNRPYSTLAGKPTPLIMAQNQANQRLQLERMELVFEDETKDAVVTSGSKLSAKALINYKGAGRIAGEWQVATPESTAGKPGFHSIGLVNKVVSGKDVLVIDSPELPVATTGTYLLRLILTEPQAAFEFPGLRYSVVSKP